MKSWIFKVALAAVYAIYCLIFNWRLTSFGSIMIFVVIASALIRFVEILILFYIYDGLRNKFPEKKRNE
jgi:hypothetical protein